MRAISLRHATDDPIVMAGQRCRCGHVVDILTGRGQVLEDWTDCWPSRPAPHGGDG